jgi:hypothetical protein
VLEKFRRRHRYEDVATFAISQAGFRVGDKSAGGTGAFAVPRCRQVVQCLPSQSMEELIDAIDSPPAQSAVDEDFFADDEVGVIGEEEAGELGDFFGLAHALDERLGGVAFLEGGLLVGGQAEALENGGLDRAGADHIDADATRGEFGGERFAKGGDGSLGGGVERDRGEADLRGDGGGEDDGTALAEERQQALELEERAADVDVEHVVVAGGGGGFERGELGDAGVEKDAVEMVHVFFHLGAEGERGFEGAGVGLQENRAFRERGLGGGEVFGIAAGDDDPGALGSEELGGGEANAGRAASDEDDFVFHGMLRAFS